MAKNKKIKLAARKHLTEMGNAERLIEYHGQDLRYCSVWNKWLVWDGRRWIIDYGEMVTAKAKDTVMRIYSEAKKGRTTEEQGKISNYAKASEAEKRIKAMIYLAKSEPGVAIHPDKLDSDPWALNVLNGTIDLRTGELRPQRCEDLLTKMAPIKFNPEAKAPRWEQFVLEIMGGNVEMAEYLRRALGYGITGNIREHKLFIFHGDGRNGKTTLLNAIQSTLGIGYADVAAPNLLLQKKYESHPTELADLFGKRFVSTSEVENGRRLSEALVKQLTGGDPIKAHRMREDFWFFNPTHKFFMATNHKPLIHGNGHAIWSRIHMIPFNISFEGRADKELPEKLEAERAGILTWMVRGSVEWFKNGLGEPPEVVAAVKEYRNEMDPLKEFLTECCETGEQYQATSADLFQSFQKFHQENGGGIMSKPEFGKCLKDHGFSQKRTKDDRLWLGLTLRGDTR